jgi:hypothetical protein
LIYFWPKNNKQFVRLWGEGGQLGCRLVGWLLIEVFWVDESTLQGLWIASKQSLIAWSSIDLPTEIYPNKLSSPELFPIFPICLFIQPTVELVDNDFKSTSTIFVINFSPSTNQPTNLARFNFNVNRKTHRTKTFFGLQNWNCVVFSS